MFLRAIAGLAFCALALAPARAASVEYPAFGNLDLAEGTFEIWFTPLAGMEPEANASKWQQLYRFLEMDSPGFFTAQLTVTQNNNQPKVRVRLKDEADKMLAVGTEKESPAWQKDVPARVAFAWKGRWMGVYVDGVLQSERTQLAGFGGTAANVAIRLGGVTKKEKTRPWLLQAVRISSVARPAEALKDAKPEADEFTLLLDRAADWKNAAKKTQPTVIAQIAGQELAGTFGDAAEVSKDAARPGLKLD